MITLTYLKLPYPQKQNWDKWPILLVVSNIFPQQVIFLY